jgi:hypothetical protein
LDAIGAQAATGGVIVAGVWLVYLGLKAPVA